MNRIRPRWVALGSVLLLAGCVTLPPSGPSVMVLPGTGKNFDQFRADDYECRNFASAQLGGSTADQAQVDSAVKSAALGTAVGAAAGAAMGGGHQGAAAGAGMGLLFGAAAGAGSANASAYALQRRYDIGYLQCMYAKGHQVPTSGRYNGGRSYGYASPPPAAVTPPPPPPGTPPPPPPR